MREIIVLAAVTLVAARLLQRRLPDPVVRALFALGILIPFAGLFYAMYLLWDTWITWRELSLFVGLYVVTAMGVTLGWHRYLTHRSFETGPVVKFVILASGAMANQGRCISWAAYHLKHHANSDREGDPHSPHDGFLHAYCGWIIRGPHADRERYCRRLIEDRVVRFIDQTGLVWVLVGLFVPYLVAGWRGVLWGGLARIAFTNHLTFTVNSFGHVYGSQPFDTGDHSKNNGFIALLSFGDGWHNNHHAFPAMASHGMSAWQFDPTGYVIRGFARLGLVWNVKGPPDARATERRRRPQADAAEGIAT
jgi:stearoyl-CoA desaturase (Delta-9 desaturase)